jgi:hypothetical protein
MIPKVMKGRSFKGAAAYLLHDTHDHGTAARVTWTQTLNLATRNPDTAWKVMAATAMNAEQLKAEAGIKATGRKAQHSVLHLVLSWHPEEKPHLTREEMSAAAESAIHALGGSDRQALIIAHNDSPHPHVHILLNRHCPDTGRILPSSKEKLKLSQWAQAYERERGKIYCEERVHNNDARQRGDFTRGLRPVPRQIIAATKVLREASNDNPDRLAQLKAKQHQHIKTLGTRTRALKGRHADAWQRLQDTDRARRQHIVQQTAQALARARQSLIERYRPLWRELRASEQAQRDDFQAREKTQFGRLRNAFKTINTQHSVLEGPKPNIVSQIWRTITSASDRAAMHERQILRERHALGAKQRSAIRDALIPLHAQYQLAQRRAAERFTVERMTLIEVQKAERSALRDEWRRLSSEHKVQTKALQASLEGKRTFAQESEGRSLLERLKDQSAERSTREKAPEQDNERDQERER